MSVATSNKLESIELRVEGLPPAKSEALSMMGRNHPHASRVVRLLRAARDTATERGFAGFGTNPLKLDVVLRTPDAPPSDVTNYAGGIADVLEEKAHRGRLEHLGDLAGVALYSNDRQVRELYVRHERGADGYTVRLSEL